MADPRLLVLGAGPAQLGLLATARQAGIVVIAVDRDPGAPGFRYAHRRALVAVEDESALGRLARAERVDGVVTSGSDRFVAAAARVAAKLGVPHPLRAETAQAATSRQRERELLAGAGLPQPEAILCHSPVEVERAAEQLGYPCAIAAIDRQDEGRAVAHGRGDVDEALATALADSRSGSCLVEEVPLGGVLTVTAFVAAGGLRSLLVSENASAGPAWPPASVGTREAGAAVRVVARAAAALGVEAGPISARVAVRQEAVSVLRVAPRLGRDHEPELCRAVTGAHLNALAIGAALGDSPHEQDAAPAPRVGGACIHFLNAPGAEAYSVEGLEAAFALPGVRGIRIYRRRAARGGGRAGAVLAVGADRAAALAAAERAAGRVRFETAHADALV